MHIFSESNQLAYGFKMGMIKQVRKRLGEVAADRIKFSFTEGLIGMQFLHRKREDTHSFVRKEEVIGREGERRLLESSYSIPM